MKGFKSQCPFTKKVFIPEARIEQVCSHVLVAMGLMPEEPSPIRIDRFIEKHFGIDIEYGDLHSRFGSGVMGACRFDRDGEVSEVIVEVTLEADESKTGQRRVRSTMAHEAGHGLFHGSLFAEKFQVEEELKRNGLVPVDNPIGITRDGFACRGLGDRQSNVDRYDWWEVQANKAMSSLLLPRQLVDPYVRLVAATAYPPLPWGGRGIIPTLTEVAGAVADKFNVSISMAQYRIEKLYDQISTQPDLF